MSLKLDLFSPKNIIVRMPNWIGDLVMATPILADLRSAYPSARITAMCRSPVGELLKSDPAVDAIFSFTKGGSAGCGGEIIERLREGQYDLGILLTHSLSSAWWFWRGKVGRRIGYESNGRRWLLNQSVPFPKEMSRQHLVLTYKSLLAPLGLKISETAPRLYLSQEEERASRELLLRRGIPEGAKIVGINPGATYGSAKCWLPSRFRRVSELLLTDDNLYLVFFGDLATKDLVGEICWGLPPSRVVNLAGKTSLRELGAGIACCDILLTNDSGPMHVADAVGTEVVAIFGSTSDVVTGPYRSGTVIHKRVECSPCYERTCPLDFRCMKQIEVDEVYEAVRHRLEHAGALLS